jgi:hypothetical protein
MPNEKIEISSLTNEEKSKLLNALDRVKKRMIATRGEQFIFILFSLKDNTPSVHFSESACMRQIIDRKN